MTLDENDYLTYQLYTASKTTSNNYFLEIYFFVATVVSAIFFPFYSRWRYKNHYRKYIRDTYKNRFGEKNEIEFTDAAITTRSNSGEVKVNTSEIEEINEIESHIFFKCKSGMSLIVSKSKSDPEDVEKIKNEIKTLVSHGIKHNIELGWKW